VIRAAVLTLSDSGARGEREDVSGRTVCEMLSGLAEVAAYEVLPDERELIADRLRALADGGDIRLIVTTGGTGVAPRDVTPEATLDVIDRELPGMAEAMRAESLKHTPNAMLSRAVCGLRDGVLIINLPGSPKAVRECLSVVLPAICHATEKAGGDETACAVP